MTTQTALPESFSHAQAKKAVDALHAHYKKVVSEREEIELIPREEYIWISVNTKSPTTKKKLMPITIQLPNPPLPPPPATSVCLIVKDPQRTYKELLETHGVKFVNRVVGIEKLKGKFKPFEARRELMREHDLFLCDDRVVPMMPKLLGKMFFEAKKQPIPVNVLRKDLKAELGRAISSTYFHPTTGTSYSIRISTPSASTTSQSLANLTSALPQIVANIPGEWDNILSVGIKTSTSVLLPIWNSPLDGRFKDEEDVDMEKERKDSKGAKSFKKAIAKAKKEKAPAQTEEDIAEVEPEVEEKKEKKEKKEEKEKKVAGKSEKSIGKEGRKKVSSAGAAGKKTKASIIGSA